MLNSEELSAPMYTLPCAHKYTLPCAHNGREHDPETATDRKLWLAKIVLCVPAEEEGDKESKDGNGARRVFWPSGDGGDLQPQALQKQ